MSMSAHYIDDICRFIVCILFDKEFCKLLSIDFHLSLDVLL